MEEKEEAGTPAEVKLDIVDIHENELEAGSQAMDSIYVVQQDAIDL